MRLQKDLNALEYHKIQNIKLFCIKMYESYNKYKP